jgi:hypothetical protein
MIRIGLPPPLLPRLRLHWHNTHSLFSRQARLLRESATRTAEVSRDWWLQVRAGLSTRLSLRARALSRHRTRLACFEQKYEALVDLLCGAARDGMHGDQEARYRELRAWMQTHYRTLGPRLRPYWATLEETASDPFEALFHQENVNDVIHAATGIEDIMRTRAALDAYRAVLDEGASKG